MKKMFEKFSGENIKDHIVRIANHIFSKFGFKKTTIDDIAQTLGKGLSLKEKVALAKETDRVCRR
ncbi:MAG: hypothetical protein KGY60_03720 [Bacteroidales bacterium]|nr:hypothetical protein [Bacteroidales bacterium]